MSWLKVTVALSAAKGTSSRIRACKTILRLFDGCMREFLAELRARWQDDRGGIHHRGQERLILAACEKSKGN